MTKTTKTPKILFAAAIIASSALALTGAAQAQGAAPPAVSSAPDLSGTYQCQPNPAPCLWSGPSPSVSQAGNKAEIKNDKGETADAMMTSDITLSAGAPLNSLGIVRPDHLIDWSNGTIWRKL
jgi:hypothetical protein